MRYLHNGFRGSIGDTVAHEVRNHGRLFLKSAANKEEVFDGFESGLIIGRKMRADGCHDEQVGKVALGCEAGEIAGDDDRALELEVPGEAGLAAGDAGQAQGVGVGLHNGAQDGKLLVGEGEVGLFELVAERLLLIGERDGCCRGAEVDGGVLVVGDGFVLEIFEGDGLAEEAVCVDLGLDGVCAVAGPGIMAEDQRDNQKDEEAQENAELAATGRARHRSCGVGHAGIIAGMGRDTNGV